MKLYDLTYGQRFRLLEDASSPPDLRGYHATQEFTFHNVDGMYSYCTDDYGRVHHPVAWAEVEVVKEAT
jgi:hypothetical protein